MIRNSCEVGTSTHSSTVSAAAAHTRFDHPSPSSQIMASSVPFFRSASGFARGSYNNIDSHKSAPLLLKCAAGIAIAIPTVAALQGFLLLNDFRIHHRDAPHPISPSRGVVVVSTQDLPLPVPVVGLANNRNRNRNRNRNHNHKQNEEEREKNKAKQHPPLRLLVIGDSLAAGVGTSKSGTPILPESIARSLSKAMGGRAVYWTCVGTPGASASQIVRDIYDFDDGISHSDGLQDKLGDWYDSLRAREWWLEQKKRHLRGWGQRRFQGRQVVDDDRLDDSEEKSSTNKFERWWKGLQQNIFPNNIEESPAIGTTSTSSANDNSTVESTNANRGTRHIVQKIKQLPSHNEEAVLHMQNNDYDIAVVLTGINDLKEAVNPFKAEKWRRIPGATSFDTALASADESNDSRVGDSDGGLKEELMQVLRALKGKMKLDLNLRGSNDTDTNTPPSLQQSTNGEGHVNANEAGAVSSRSSPLLISSRAIDDVHESQPLAKCQGRRGPLVVFPAIPASPLPILQDAPLRWFARPLLESIEHKKKLLCERYPGSVLFVESPSRSTLLDIEDGKGILWANRRRENVLVKLDDVTHWARHEVETLMKEHWHKFDKFKGRYSGGDRDHGNESEEQPHDVFEQSCHDHQLPERSTTASNIPGITLIAADKFHPNDEGYEFWGRHIAEAIVIEWNKEEQLVGK